jgi:hypothetical protein
MTAGQEAVVQILLFIYPETPEIFAIRRLLPLAAAAKGKF